MANAVKYLTGIGRNNFRLIGNCVNLTVYTAGSEVRRSNVKVNTSQLTKVVCREVAYPNVIHVDFRLPRYYRRSHPDAGLVCTRQCVESRAGYRRTALVESIDEHVEGF